MATRRYPPILLIMGIGSSMLWWEEDFCRMLAGGRRFVIRYDHRDTGRSITYEPGRPEYTGADLTADAAGVLDGFGLSAAHLVGVSAGGGIAQEVALDSADRMLSLTLISTSPATPGDRDLPPPTAEFGRFVATAGAELFDSPSTAWIAAMPCARRPAVDHGPRLPSAWSAKRGRGAG